MNRTDYNILRRLLRNLKQGLWFRPLLWILGWLLLSAAVYLGFFLLGPDLARLPEVKPDTARSLLELLASTMLTITTVSFSMVLVVMTFISGQLSPRSIPGVLRDQAIQDALGIFLAGLVYGLGGMLIFETLGLWPNGPLVTVVLSAVICALTVIYLMRLIHHVSRRVQVSYILAQQRDLADAAIASFFEVDPPGRPLAPPAAMPEGEPVCLRAPHSGYLQVLNLHDVYDIAVREDLLVRVHHGEGDYVGRGWPMFELWSERGVDEAVRDSLLGAAQVGESRTPEGDPLFPLEVMGEIGERALSPGVNDTGTALAALDHLADCLLRWAPHPERSPWIGDGDGRRRILIEPPRLATALERTVARLLRCGEDNPEVRRKVLWLVDRLAPQRPADEALQAMVADLRRRALAAQAQASPAPPHPDLAATG